MNPDSPKPLREELESRLSALLLGELPAAEAALLREIIAHDAELVKLHDQLQQTISWVREATTTTSETVTEATVAPPRLSAERREKLLAQFKTVTLAIPISNKRRRVRFVELAAVFVILGLLALVTIPNLVKSRHTASANTVLNNLRQLDAAKQQWAIENNQTSSVTPTFSDIKLYLGRGEMPSVGGEEYVLGKVGEPPSAEIDASDARKTFGQLAANLPKGGRGDRLSLSADGQVSVVDQNTLTVTTGLPKGEAAQLARNTWGLKPPAAKSGDQLAFESLPEYTAKDGLSSVVPAAQPTPPPRAEIVLPALATDADYTGKPQDQSQTQGEPKYVGVLKGAQTRYYSATNAISHRFAFSESPAHAGDLGVASTDLPVAPKVAEPPNSELNDTLRRRSAQTESSSRQRVTVAGGRGGRGGGVIGGGAGTGGPVESVAKNLNEPGATVSADPETRRLIVVTDGDTSAQIANIVNGLDRGRSPSPAMPWATNSNLRGFSDDSVGANLAQAEGKAPPPSPASGPRNLGRVAPSTQEAPLTRKPAAGIVLPNASGTSSPVSDESRTLQLRFATAPNVADALNSRPDQDTKAQVDSFNNQVTFSTGDKEGEKLIAKLDVPTKQQLIEQGLAVSETKYGDVETRDSTDSVFFRNNSQPADQSIAAERGGFGGGGGGGGQGGAGLFTIPRGSVTRPAQGGGGRGANRATAGSRNLDEQNRLANSVLNKSSSETFSGGVDANAGSLDRAEASSELALQDIAALSGRAAQVPVLGDTPVQGRAFTNSARNDVVAPASFALATNGEWTDNAQHAKQGGLDLAVRGKLRDAIDSEGRQLTAIPESGRERVVAAVDESVLRRASPSLIPRAEAEKGSTSEASVRNEDLVRLERLATGSTEVPEKRQNVSVFDLDNADPAEVQDILEEMFSKTQVASGGSSATSDKLTGEKSKSKVVATIKDRVPDLSDSYLAELNRNGYAVVSNGQGLTIVPKDLARNNLLLGANPSKIPPGGEIVTQIIPIRSRAASKVVAELTSNISPQGVLKANDGDNAIVITDTHQNIQRLAKIIDSIDVPRKLKASTNAPIPQPEIVTSENNFSTFSLNVSDVSFKLAAASLEKGQMPDAATVRSEEFINAFDYRDPEPLPGAPIAFAWERVRYPFAVNRDLLRFSLKTAAAGRQAGRPLNIVLLLDNSGSMERADRVQIIREALRVLASQLQPQDKLSVITFARTARLVADGIPGNQAGAVTEQVSGLTPQGGTNLEEAMNLAYETAARHYLIGGINRVVLLTDGAANLGDVEPSSLKQKVEEARQQGIALDCFGVGWEGFNDDLLEMLSRNGDGRYGFINSPVAAATEFAGQLAGALQVAASDVKVQVEFNPQRVTSYRQIGYAKHQLTKEQFRDNTVDAAEIAAQEAGNALYTVEVNPAGSGSLATMRVRYKVPGTTDYREQAWEVPFTGNALALEHSSPAMRLAASASAFSEWLVASPFAGEVTPDALLGYLRGVPEVFGADSRPTKLESMIRQAKSLAGQ